MAAIFASCLKATGALTRGATTDLLAVGDTATIGATTYTFKTTTTTAGDIYLSASSDAATAAALTSLAKVLNGTATLAASGADAYTGTTQPHPIVKGAVSADGLVLTVTARMPGLQGNHIPTTEVIVDAQITWGAAVLGSGSGNPTAKIQTWLDGIQSASQVPSDIESEIEKYELEIATTT